MTGLCTSHAVYPGKPAVHAAYMPRKRPTRGGQPKRQQGAERRWRPNHIALWRKAAGLSQQEVADRLVERGFDYDRVSVTRVENGRQNPGIVVLEAIAQIVKAPSVSAMTDYTPGQWATIQQFIEFDHERRELALRLVDIATMRR